MWECKQIGGTNGRYSLFCLCFLVLTSQVIRLFSPGRGEGKGLPSLSGIYVLLVGVWQGVRGLMLRALFVFPS